eukprot:8894100-Lingulodinium_polyedra.AAC.1
MKDSPVEEDLDPAKIEEAYFLVRRDNMDRRGEGLGKGGARWGPKGVGGKGSPSSKGSIFPGECW